MIRLRSYPRPLCLNPAPHKHAPGTSSSLLLFSAPPRLGTYPSPRLPSSLLRKRQRQDQDSCRTPHEAEDVGGHSRTPASAVACRPFLAHRLRRQHPAPAVRNSTEKLVGAAAAERRGVDGRRKGYKGRASARAAVGVRSKAMAVEARRGRRQRSRIERGPARAGEGPWAEAVAEERDVGDAGGAEEGEERADADDEAAAECGREDWREDR